MKPLIAMLVSVAGSVPCLVSSASAQDADKLEAALAEPVSLHIERDSLERCLLALQKKARARHPDFAIKIIGADLEKDGITKNQQIRNLDLEDKPVADVLTELMLRGGFNPGKDPASPEQKLVWIVGEDPEHADRLIILVTTRAGAKQRGDKLPKVFHLQVK